MITIVVVLYKSDITTAQTTKSLHEFFLANSQLLQKTNIILYDNSPQRQENPYDYAEYVWDARNLGVAAAYNYALTKAKERGDSWLYLLDQDTSITAECLIKQLDCAINAEEDCVAIVPIVRGRKATIISPQKIVHNIVNGGGVKTPGTYNNIGAINTCSLLKISFLDVLGGFTEVLPLDMLDHWLYYKIREANKQVCVVAAEIRQDLSVQNYNTSMNTARYGSILKSELEFLRLVGRPDDYKRYRNKLILRLCKQILLVKDKNYARMTFSQWKALI